MDLNLLALFVAVAETTSFSTAAKRLGMPKSSVSRGVAKLEADLGLRLLHRTTRQVSLSTAGTALYERAAPLLASLGESVADLPELEAQPSGKLRLTATVDFGVSVLADIIARFNLRFPAIEIDLHLTGRVVDLVAEGFDLAFRFGPDKLVDSSLVARAAARLSSGLYASPTYLARRKTPRTPRDLDGHDWVQFRPLPTIELESAGKTVSVVPRGRVSIDDMLMMRTMVAAGAGIGFLPSFLAGEQCAGGSLVQVLPKWTTRTGTLWLVSPSSQHIPRKLSAFRDFFVESLARHPLA